MPPYQIQAASTTGSNSSYRASSRAPLPVSSPNATAALPSKSERRSMPRPIHFEIPADNSDRAIAFYQSAFGWQFMKWEGEQPYWLITTGAKDTPGIDGGMMMRRFPGESTVN